MDEAQKLEIGARIRQLRERSPYKQQAVADKLGIGLRAYQKLEEVGTTRYERCEELADIFEVEPMWIWEGRERGSTPDLFAPFGGSEPSARLSQIESALADVQEQLAWLVAQQKAAAARDEAQEHLQEQQQQTEPQRARSGS